MRNDYMTIMQMSFGENTECKACTESGLGHSTTLFYFRLSILCNKPRICSTL